MNVRLSFGEWLEDMLKERRWTQAAFADSLGVARQTVNGWLHGDPPRRRRLIRDMAKVLEVDFDEVLVRAGQPPTDPDYQLPGEHGEDEDHEIDVTDPLLEISAANAHLLTDDQKRLVGELIKQFAREGKQGP